MVAIQKALLLSSNSQPWWKESPTVATSKRTMSEAAGAHSLASCALLMSLLEALVASVATHQRVSFFLHFAQRVLVLLKLMTELGCLADPQGIQVLEQLGFTSTSLLHMLHSKLQSLW